jgi:hypothetical protein
LKCIRKLKSEDIAMKKQTTFNKTQVKKLIKKHTKKGVLSFNKQDGYLMTDYFLLTITGEINDILNELFPGTEKLTIKHGEIDSNHIDVKRFAEDTKSYIEVKYTEFSRDLGKLNCRLMYNSNDDSITYVDNEFLKMFNGKDTLKFYNNSKVSPVILHNDDYMVGFMLPCRLNDNNMSIEISLRETR